MVNVGFFHLQVVICHILHLSSMFIESTLPSSLIGHTDQRLCEVEVGGIGDGQLKVAGAPMAALADIAGDGGERGKLGRVHVL